VTKEQPPHASVTRRRRSLPRYTPKKVTIILQNSINSRWVFHNPRIKAMTALIFPGLSRSDGSKNK
jgi:hypothetical protein